MQQAEGSVIAVSKLCCPVCWEALQIFRRNMPGDDAYNVRGRHSSLHLTELPSWLPSEALDDLLLRFRELARQELQKMIENLKGLGPGHKRRISESNETGSAFSVDSEPEAEFNPDPGPTNFRMVITS